RQRVQVQRHGRDERLTLTRRHLRNLALVQRDRADQLHIVGDHVPDQRDARDHDLRPDQAPARLLHRRVGLGQDVVQRRLELRLERVFDPTRLDRQALALARVRRLPLLFAQLRKLRLQRLRPLPDDAAQLLRLPPQLFLGKRREPLRDLVDLRDQRLEPLDLTVVPRPEKSAYQGLQHSISDVYGWKSPHSVLIPRPGTPGPAIPPFRGRRGGRQETAKRVTPTRPPHRPRRTGRAHG